MDAWDKGCRAGSALHATCSNRHLGFDVALDFEARPFANKDFCRRRPHQRILQHLQRTTVLCAQRTTPSEQLNCICWSACSDAFSWTHDKGIIEQRNSPALLAAFVNHVQHRKNTRNYHLNAVQLKTTAVIRSRGVIRTGGQSAPQH